MLSSDIDASLRLPQIVLDDVPVLNPTFHPLVPLRLFLTALAGESYRVLSDDSFFFKPSAKKLFAKFSTPVSEAAVRFLFQFANRLDLLRIKGGKAHLSLDTLYALNFNDAQFLYFAYFMWSPFSILIGTMAGSAGVSPQTWFDADSVDALLRHPLSLTYAFDPRVKLTRNPLFWQDETVSLPLSVSDFARLGFLVDRTIKNKRYVQFNPWYHEWLFDHIPSLKRDRHSDFQKKFIVQPNYEVLLPPDLAWPSFLQLIALTTAYRCDLVCHLRISKASVASGIHSGIDPEECASFFEHHAWTLPDNVRQSIESWSRDGARSATSKRPSARHSQLEELDLKALRKEANRFLSISWNDRLKQQAKKLGGPLVLEPQALPVLKARQEMPIKTMAAPPSLTPPAATNRHLLFLLEECIRNKTACTIVHNPREGRTRHREVIPLRLHRDGISIYLESHCLDLDIIRSFKLDQILDVIKIV